jgi:hypothetical protein
MRVCIGFKLAENGLTLLRWHRCWFELRRSIYEEALMEDI